MRLGGLFGDQMGPDAQVVRVIHLSIIEVKQIDQGLPLVGERPRTARLQRTDTGDVQLRLRLLGLLKATHEIADQHLVPRTEQEIAHATPIRADDTVVRAQIAHGHATGE
jgi:hypothetical protein